MPSNTIQVIGSFLNAGYIGDTVQETLDDIQQQLNENMKAIQRLVPYLSGMYHTDVQRRIAERELFRLQAERSELEVRVHNALVIIPDLLYPILAVAQT